MAVKKSVAASSNVSEATIPATASGAGELETSHAVTTSMETEGVEKAPSISIDVAAQTRSANLAKARAARAAKGLAKKAAEVAAARIEAKKEITGIQSALAAEARQDHHSFGEIKEVARMQPTAEEYVRVEVPLTDLFDHAHPGVQLNRHKFEPGKTYLLRGDVALEVKKRLAMFHDEQVRLLRPNADRKALNDVNRGSQWTSRGGNAVVPLGRLEDVSVGADEKIYTVDF